MEPVRTISLTVDQAAVQMLAGSFEQLFAVEQHAMLRLAESLVDVPERAEEIVQDAFEKTLLAWPKLREPGAYLRTAVVNGCRGELRRRRVMRRHPDPVASSVGLGEPDRSLIIALARLTPQRRIALTLRYFVDLTESDIAAVMGVRPGTVKSLISRGLADLRRPELRKLVQQ